MGPSLPDHANKVVKQPALDLSYQIGLKAYDVTIQRTDAKENQIARSLAFISSTTLAIVTFAVVQLRVDTGSLCFYGAVVLFCDTLILGFWGLIRGPIRTLSPQRLHDEYLNCEGDEFQQEILKRSGEAFEKNRALLDLKHRVLFLILLLYIIELTLIMIWITLTPASPFPS